MGEEIIKVFKDKNGIVEKVVFEEENLDVAFRAIVSTLLSFCSEYGVTISDLIMSLIVNTDNLLSIEEVADSMDPSMVGNREVIAELAEVIADSVIASQKQPAFRS